MSRRKSITAGFALVVLGSLVYYFYPYGKIPAGIIIDRIVVRKSEHRMFVYAHGALIHTYTIAIGKGSAGDKQFQGDKKTPEGSYYIFAKNPSSAYHKNLGISYPNADDRAAAKSLGMPAGGDVKIHGLKNGQGYIGRFQRWKDWTNGCIGLTNEEIDDLYEHTPVGTPIIISR